jgi:hypothetical protein
MRRGSLLPRRSVGIGRPPVPTRALVFATGASALVIAEMQPVFAIGPAARSSARGHGRMAG